MPIASVDAPQLSAQPPLYKGPRATVEARASLERQMIAELGSERASYLRQWVALIGETVSWEVVEYGQTKRTFQPTEYAIGHAVRRSPADAAAEFGVSETALGRYVRATDSLSPLTPGRVAASAAGGLNWERERLGNILSGNESSTIPAFWYQSHFAALPVFGALCRAQSIEVDDLDLLKSAESAHHALRLAARDYVWKAEPGKKNRPANRLRDALRECVANQHPRAPTWTYLNMRVGERNRVDDAAATAALKLQLGSIFFEDRSALLAALEALLADYDFKNVRHELVAFRDAIDMSRGQDDVDSAWKNAPLNVRWILDLSGFPIYRFPEGEIDRDALKVAIEVASKPWEGETKRTKPVATNMRLAEITLYEIYLRISGQTPRKGQKRIGYTKRKEYEPGDRCPFVGPYVDFLRDCGWHYRLGSGPNADTLADFLPWRLKLPD